ncbi:MAG: hypothetical protein JNK82_18590 [Myxococcaceae bacterium]|nr:hypothetical protein [Myxococcaceae bacterium]
MSPAISATARRRSVAVVMFAWVGLVAQLTSFGHMATPHQVCAEHGELVHGADAAGQPAIAIADDDVVTAALPATAGDQHDHCDLLADARRQLVSQAAVSTFAPQPAPDGSSVLESAHAAQVALLAVAPKSSPPAS